MHVDSNQSFKVMQAKLLRTSTAVKLDPGYAACTIGHMAALHGDLGKTIQANVKRFRLEAGLTQQALAVEAEVSVDAIRKWEGGRGVPDRESLTKLAQALGRRMDDFNMADPPPPPARRVPPFILKMAEDAPDDLRKRAEDYIEQLNREVAQRDTHYPPGVRRSRGKSELTTIQSAGGARSLDRPAHREETPGPTSARSHRRR